MDLPERRTSQAPARDIRDITAEVKELQRQAKNIVLMYAVEIGRNLAEAKSILRHGEWGEWLKNEVEFSQSSANNYMKLYEEYGSQQISLFGNIANSQSIANLPYTKALQLLSVPTDERQEFVDAHPVEEMSVKELQEAIRERDQARQEAETAKKIQKAAEQESYMAKQEAEQARQEAENARAEVQGMIDEALAEAEARAEDLEHRLRKAEKQEQDLTAQWARQEVEIREEARIKAEADTEKAMQELQEKERKAVEKLADKIGEVREATSRADEAEEKLKKAEEEKAAMQAHMEELQKKAAAAANAGQSVAAFKTLFNQLQKLAKEMRENLEQIAETDPELSGKLRNAMRAFGGTL